MLWISSSRQKVDDYDDSCRNHVGQYFLLHGECFSSFALMAMTSIPVMYNSGINKVSGFQEFIRNWSKVCPGNALWNAGEASRFQIFRTFESRPVCCAVMPLEWARYVLYQHVHSLDPCRTKWVAGFGQRRLVWTISFYNAIIGSAVRADFRRLYPANAKTSTCCPSDDNRTKVTNSVTSARSLWWHVGPYFWPADLTRTANPIGSRGCMLPRELNMFSEWTDPMAGGVIV